MQGSLRAYSSSRSWRRAYSSSRSWLGRLRTRDTASDLIVFSAYVFVGPPCLARSRSASGRRIDYWNRPKALSAFSYVERDTRGSVADLPGEAWIAGTQCFDGPAQGADELDASFQGFETRGITLAPGGDNDGGGGGSGSRGGSGPQKRSP